jgi:zinc and cadmium transporter
MPLLLWVVIFALIGGVFSLAGGVMLLLARRRFEPYLGSLTSFAAGVLVAVSVLDLIPEAFEMGQSSMVGMSILIGILILFVMEKTNVWFHHHHAPHGASPQIVAIWFGDTLHNFIDGVAIGAAFLISIPTGVATATAVGLHELPQEFADFGLYIRAGFKNKTTLLLNFGSSLATLVGAVGIYFLGVGQADGFEVYVLALTGGMFLYIALADLVPELHVKPDRGLGMNQLYTFFLGVVVSYFSIILFH